MLYRLRLNHSVGIEKGTPIPMSLTESLSNRRLSVRLSVFENDVRNLH